MSPTPTEIVVLGAGVAGLTTAFEARQRFPSAQITIVAKYLPGFTSPTEYVSPWAGANWHSFEKERNQYAEYDAVAFKKFVDIAAKTPESGVKALPMRVIYDSDEARKNPLWYGEVVGGIKEAPKDELPAGAVMGLDMDSFMINTVAYLSWLQQQVLHAKVKFMRRSYTHIDDLMSDFPGAHAFFNCTGLGARHLGGVEDETVYPTKGQTLLIAEPITPLKRMYIQKNASWGDNEFAHVFPRPLGGGIILGGVRRDNDWTAEPDMELAERIKQRCCALAPELGKPEDLQVLSHNVGLRPSRKGGARVELEKRNGKLLVHNYGASGAGYQSSWGMAAHALDLLNDQVSQKSKL
ncbi:D-amino-acid oxidase, variant 2 [Exophiala viscosa]|uniref:D-amino-acid oxidase, variant 2 n=1 Tax=Exophiala viscosa TaxID=2486360 RepID=A0AAN6E699_9EURO|nr:D-amino-acid oxidase, variant 2 [Exophiala viscosa]